ncbi:MAG: hypothetical protein ABIJ21_06860 [Nanoarchaeota archaeon]
MKNKHASRSAGFLFAGALLGSFNCAVVPHERPIGERCVESLDAHLETFLREENSRESEKGTQLSDYDMEIEQDKKRILEFFSKDKVVSTYKQDEVNKLNRVENPERLIEVIDALLQAEKDSFLTIDWYQTYIAEKERMLQQHGYWNLKYGTPQMYLRAIATIEKIPIALAGYVEKHDEQGNCAIVPEYYLFQYAEDPDYPVTPRSIWFGLYPRQIDETHIQIQMERREERDPWILKNIIFYALKEQLESFSTGARIYAVVDKFDYKDIFSNDITFYIVNDKVNWEPLSSLPQKIFSALENAMK